MNIFEEAIHKWGTERQVMKALCEMSELALAIHHDGEDKCETIDVLSEIADVEIMLEQLKIIYDPLGELYSSIKSQKIGKLMTFLRR